MSWIKDFTKGTFSLMGGNPLEAFQPIDFFHFYTMYHDLWIVEIDDALQIVGAYEKSYDELKEMLPVPSSIRAVLLKLVLDYAIMPEKDAAVYRRVCDFFARMLAEAVPEDPFALSSHRTHTQAEIADVVGTVDWQPATIAEGRRCGQLLTAAGSIVHGIYNDVVTDYGWDTYGPYMVDTKHGQRSLLVRHFPELRPSGMYWDDALLPSFNEVKMYGLYEGIEWTIAGVGCHTIPENGSPAQALRKYAVEVDGVIIDAEREAEIMAELSEKSVAIYTRIREMQEQDTEELKKMVLHQECYQLNRLMTAAGKEWRPSAEMIERIQGKKIPSGIMPMDKMVQTLEEYSEMFGIDVFEREVIQ